MDKRLHIYYSGTVQGVGFRYTAERLASTFKLAGWAKNLPDGRVEVVCEGPEAVLKDFAGKLHSVFKSYITDTDIEWSMATGEFSYFDIKF